MGLISFIKNAGEKLFKSEEKREQEKAALITSHIKKFGFDTSSIQVAVDDDKVTLTGSIDTIENKNKVIVTAGNVDGIASVDDRIMVRTPPVVTPPAPEKQFYTVKKGDYLQKSPNRYTGMPINIMLFLKQTNPC